MTTELRLLKVDYNITQAKEATTLELIALDSIVAEHLGDGGTVATTHNGFQLSLDYVSYDHEADHEAAPITLVEKFDIETKTFSSEQMELSYITLEKDTRKPYIIATDQEGNEVLVRMDIKGGNGHANK